MVTQESVTAFYLGCFVFGLLFTVVSLISGIGRFRLPHRLGRIGPRLHLRSGHRIALRGPGRGVSVDETPSPFDLQTVVAFVTCFGGIGYGLSIASRLGGGLVLALATLSGIVGAGALFLFVARFLIARQTPWLRASDYDLTGTIARVNSRIKPNGMGEVVFTKLGTRRVEAARTTSSEIIEREHEVVIVRYEHGVALVEPIEQFFEPPLPAAR